jgi:probable DNA repair protein
MATIKGGSSLVKNQAACPFRAFARHRLTPGQESSPSLGFTPLQRGQIVHKVLQFVWQEWEDQQTLLALPEMSLINHLQKHIERALKSVDLALAPVPSTLLKLEKERLVKLIHRWLDMEKQRPPFRVVAREQTLQIKLLGLSLRLQLDRLDELEDGRYLIIDYKTGPDFSPNHWQGPRPKEPQLPLYCLSREIAVDGLAFAIIHPRDIKFNGLSDTDMGIPGIAVNKERSWQQQYQHWETTLQTLAAQFIQGDAQVDPKDENTCNYCELKSFCRIDEKT